MCNCASVQMPKLSMRTNYTNFINNPQWLIPQSIQSSTIIRASRTLTRKITQMRKTNVFLLIRAINLHAKERDVQIITTNYRFEPKHWSKNAIWRARQFHHRHTTSRTCPQLVRSREPKSAEHDMANRPSLGSRIRTGRHAPRGSRCWTSNQNMD